MRLSQALAKTASFSAFQKLPLLFPFLFPTTHSSGADVHRRAEQPATYGQEAPLPYSEIAVPAAFLLYLASFDAHPYIVPVTRTTISSSMLAAPDCWKVCACSETTTYQAM